MPLTLIKETGAGLVDANSYADVADGDAYHDGHLYATAWTGASDDQKAVALVMASRLIDAEWQFNGTRTNAVQGMQWPRARCPEPDAIHVPLQVLLPIPSDFVRFDSVPKAVTDATCEMARELLITDRTTAPPGEGLKYFNNAGVQTGYDKTDRRPVLSRVVMVMLAKYGVPMSATSGMTKLQRV
jgi:hypothetical protein